MAIAGLATVAALIVARVLDGYLDNGNISWKVYGWIYDFFNWKPDLYKEEPVPRSLGAFSGEGEGGWETLQDVPDPFLEAKNRVRKVLWRCRFKIVPEDMQGFDTNVQWLLGLKMTADVEEGILEVLRVGHTTLQEHCARLNAQQNGELAVEEDEVSQ